MRTAIGLSVVMTVLLASSLAPRADNANGDRKREGKHWEIVAAVEYCRQLHELALKPGGQHQNEDQLDELKEALSEKYIVTLMSVAIHCSKKRPGEIKLLFWRDATKSGGREIQLVLNLRRLGDDYKWDRLERIYANRRLLPGCCPLVPSPPRIPTAYPQDYWQRTSEGRWRGMLDLVAAVAELTDALIAQDKMALSRLSLFGVESYPGLRRFGSTIADLSSVTIDNITTFCPDYYMVALTSSVLQFVLRFIATPEGWKYEGFVYRYLGDE